MSAAKDRFMWLFVFFEPKCRSVFLSKCGGAKAGIAHSAMGGIGRFDGPGFGKICG